MTLDDSIELDPRRYQRLILPVIAVIIPVVVFIGMAAWFIREFVAPPTVAITETTAAAPAPRLAAVEPPSPPAEEPARTGSVTQALPMMASLAFVPPSLPPPQTQAPYEPERVALPERTTTPEPSAEALVPPGEPIAGPIPLPKARPRIASAIVRGPVPMPRPRPTR